MKKLILIIFLMFFSLSCNNTRVDCQIKYSNYISYNGYGIIKFNSTNRGSIRYLEFYPVCNIKIDKFNISEVSNNNLNNGIVIRENYNSKLWNKLINDKNIFIDKEKYGIALIYLSFIKKADLNKDRKEFNNYLQIKDKGFKVRMVDIDLYNINTKEFKIIRSL